jgi:hypothetical protein
MGLVVQQMELLHIQLLQVVFALWVLHLLLRLVRIVLHGHAQERMDILD